MKNNLKELQEKINILMDEREWKQFHSPKNLCMNIVQEATELMEPFIWVSEEKSHKILEEKRAAIENEFADICILLVRFASLYNIDILKAIQTKLIEIAHKYPVEKAKGSCKKYNEL